MKTSFKRGGRTLSVFALLASGLAVSGVAATAAGPTVFINEIHYDNASTDAGEAIEVAGPAGTDLTGWSLVLYNGSNGSVYDTDALSGVLADQGSGYGTTVMTYPSNGIQNGSPDGVALVNDAGNVVQFLSYEGTFPAVGGPADTMTSTDIGAAQNGAGVLGNSLQLTGSGMAYEDFTWAAEQANTFGAANTGQTFGGTPADPVVVINEVDYDQPSTDAAEFVELMNVGTAVAQLDQFTLELINGNGASVYDTIALPAVSLAPGDYFVVCANAATVANCDLDDGPDTNFIQNGSPDAVALSFDGTLIDAVSYEGDTAAPYTEGSGSGLQDSGEGSISRCADGADTDQNNLDFTLTDAISPGSTNDCEPPPPPEACGDPGITFIHEIQGSGAATPLADGTEVAIEGIVVGDFQNDFGTDGDLNGFHVQEEDADTDGNAATSEGIFVFQGSNPAIDVEQGDHVRVRGTVSEFFGLTEITSSLVVKCSSGNVLPTAASITLPVASVDDFEAFEGMRVTFPQTLHATGNYTQARYGEVDLSVGGPLDNPTNVVAPGAPAAALQDLNNRSRIQLEDGSTVQNPLPLPPYLGAGNTLRTGDTVDGLTAVMHYGFGSYELQPIEPINFTRVNERLAPPDVGGSITVAAYNVLNYFTTLDDSGSICGPAADQGCRGADTLTEFEQQRAKLVAAISELDADIVGLMEIENHADDISTADLVAGLNDATQAGKYDYIASGPVGDDAIKVAIIFQPDSVSPLGPYAVLDSSVDPAFNDDKNRAVLAQTFSENGTDDVVTVAVNHLKSKGSDCDDLGDPDVGDGQGNCNLTREAAATALANWLNGDPTGFSEGQSLIIGDLNSYAQEDPIVAIETAGYTDLIESFVGTGFADGAYSYNFFSQSGYLDHGLASPAVLPRVTGASFWHVNADEPSGLDYNNFNQPDLFTPDAFRSSDHDPVVIGVCETTAPVVDVSVSPETMSPPNHKMFSVEATVSIVDADPNTTVQVSVTSNEPDNGLGDGDHPNDIVIVDDDSFELRAERSGLGDGRVYTITYEVTDACGNTTTESATVTIPHHRGPKGNWK